MTQVTENRLHFTIYGPRKAIIRNVDSSGIIDEHSQEVPYGEGPADNICIKFVDGHPHLQAFQYVKKTGNHVDIYAKAFDFDLHSVSNLKYLEKLIQEEIWNYEHPEE